MVEITTATVASAAERAAATSYVWGQTSTGPIVERRYALTDFLTYDANSNIGIGIAALSGVKLQVKVALNKNFGVITSAGGVLTAAGLTDAGSAASLMIAGSPLTFSGNGSTTEHAKLDSSGNLTVQVATGALGYSTGAGGAVTQATSRTTAVTLNKPCGAITLVSAAGSTSWQSFTVNNSLVAATDVIKVVQKSGTDKYMIHVTAVAAGSFVITFATTGGTTTEQPVFNFAIVRGVTS